MTDESAVSAEVDRCNDAGETISHGCARTIASWWNNGADTTMYSFVSTGAIHESDIELLWARFAPDASKPEFAIELRALREYLDNRKACAEFGPVPGWSNMWVR